jgi:hypothetical protein
MDQVRDEKYEGDRKLQKIVGEDMNQTITVQQLTNHLRRIEAEIVAIRQGLATMSQEESPFPEPEAASSYAWVNKPMLREQMKQFFLILPRQGTSNGLHGLQQGMAEAELLSNELSRSIIAAREE